MKSHQYLQDMATFVSVARHKSFTLAAQELDVPPSSVSRQIAQMEQRLKLKLFHRTSRSVSLTPVGVDYFAQAQSVIDAAQSVYAQVQGQTQQAKGRIRLSASITVAHDYVMPFIFVFARKYPEINIELEASQRYVDILAEGYDVVLRLSSKSLADSDLIAQPLLTFSHGLYAAPDYVAQTGEINEQNVSQKIQRQRCLVMDARQTDWRLTCQNDPSRILKVPIEICHVFGSMHMLHEAALHGLGIACLSNNVQTAQEVIEKRLIRLLPEWHTPPTTLYATIATRAQPQRVRIFLDELRAYFRL
ncbi:LysR family transcriptional regulator [Formosimonas limnophila]|uniref:LysR family transcriptional regulator n=1 Tax=Formosimonas limnophila TaxID=1384487 RepID=A0A8J3CMD9_9BURK|nr:LysR family transcriptional regulator [Formosimonas limnophila]GHA68128.1 LysR family transcriptional regulator [Formosimonas limnophila]